MRTPREAQRLAGIARRLHQRAECEMIEAARALEAAERKMTAHAAALDRDLPMLAAPPGLVADRLAAAIGEHLGLLQRRRDAVTALNIAKRRCDIVEDRARQARERHDRAELEKELAEAACAHPKEGPPAPGKPARAQSG